MQAYIQLSLFFKLSLLPMDTAVVVKWRWKKLELGKRAPPAPNVTFVLVFCLSVCARSSRRLVTLARGLSPAFLRFGGKRSDFLHFNNQKNLARFRGPGPDYYLKNYEDGD